MSTENTEVKILSFANTAEKASVCRHRTKTPSAPLGVVDKKPLAFQSRDWFVSSKTRWISSPKNAQKVFTNWWGTQCDAWWTIFELDEIFGFLLSLENQFFFWPWSLWVSQGRWSDGHSEKKLWTADDQEKATEIHGFISITLHPFVTVTCMKWTRGFPRIIFFQGGNIQVVGEWPEHFSSRYMYEMVDFNVEKRKNLFS